MSATIVVHRRSARAAMLRKYQVYLDGIKIGAVRDGGEFEAAIPAGPHGLALKLDWQTTKPISFDAVDGSTITFRCGTNIRDYDLLLPFLRYWLTGREWLWVERVAGVAG